MTRALKFVAPLLAMGLILYFPTKVGAELTSSPSEIARVTNQIIIGFSELGSKNERALIRSRALSDIQAVSSEPISPQSPQTEVVKLGSRVGVDKAIEILSNRPGIRFVEPDYLVKALPSSNDPDFVNNLLWGMYGEFTQPGNKFGSHAAVAWESGFTGSTEVVIGVIDEGIQVTHPDLAANIWVNPLDSTVDGIDNDKNGYIDDVNGWDFVNNDSSVYDGGTTGSQDKHGTHVAGTIGAVGGNEVGVVGVNWNIKMISLKFLGPSGGSTSNAIKAIDYLRNLKSAGVNVIASNNSWGGGGYSQALHDSISNAGKAGILFIAAAGNSASNNDTSVSYPSGYLCNSQSSTWDCVIAVASIDSAGNLSTFSNYGASTVDLGAPGSSIRSTLPFSGYGTYSGTSMATPHVTGAVALCRAINPANNAEVIKSIVLSSVTPTTSLGAKTVTGGRLNIGTMVSKCQSTSNLINQVKLVISTSNSTTYKKGTTGVTLSTTGGSGTGMVTYATSSTGCSISSNRLTVSTSISGRVACTVTATKAGSGIYLPTTSDPKTFNFR